MTTKVLNKCNQYYVKLKLLCYACKRFKKKKLSWLPFPLSSSVSFFEEMIMQCKDCPYYRVMITLGCCVFCPYDEQEQSASSSLFDFDHE